MSQLELEQELEGAWSGYLSLLEAYPRWASNAQSAEVLGRCVAALWNIPGLPDLLTRIPLRVLERYTRTEVAQSFWAVFEEAGLEPYERSASAIRLASDAMKEQLALIRLIKSSLPQSAEPISCEEQLRPSFTAALLHAGGGGSAERLSTFLKPFFERSVMMWDSTDLNSEGDDMAELWAKLRDLRWMPFVQGVLLRVLHSHVRRKVDEVACGVYDRPVLGELQKWKEQALVQPMKSLVYPPAITDAPTEVGGGKMDTTSDMDGSSLSMADDLRHRCEQHAAEVWERNLASVLLDELCGARAAEIFDMVADFPDSSPAVEELRIALEGSLVQLRRIATALRTSLQQRLLHPGASTAQIIDVYISAINLLNLLDPQNILLDEVAGPVRHYLQGRKDTIRCIVSALTDDGGGGDLYEELRRQDAKPLEHYADSDNEEDGPGAHWSPPMRDAPASSSSSRGDILSMLVSIYGSKELFVTEYRLMLADRLLNNLDYETDGAWQNLELLKVRFGEDSMQHCETMVRDVDESKRVNSRVHDLLVAKHGNNHEAATVLDSILVSQKYWPALQTEAMELHPRMAQRAKAFEELYRVTQPMRKLEWRSQLGSIDLELAFPAAHAGGEPILRTFTVTPLHATLIMHLEDRPSLSLEDLVSMTGATEENVKRKMALWQNHGVVTLETGGIYTLVEDQSQDTSGREGGVGEDDGGDEAVNAEAQDAAVDAVIEQFLVGMLTNLGRLPLERIHNMLKMFMANGEHKYEKSPAELSQLLSRLCSRNRLELLDGEYHLITS
jgi:anaphase-promoting complex subunit 2